MTAYAIEAVESRDLARFWPKVKKTDSCWIWQGPRNSNGYGRFYFQHRRVNAHRFAHAALIGPVPEGMVVDHLCRNRDCVNPKHLEVVTNAENVRRGLRSALLDKSWHRDMFALWESDPELTALDVARRIGRSHGHVAALLRTRPKRYFSRTCGQCGAAFESERHNARWCSRRCAKTSSRANTRKVGATPLETT